MWHLVCGAARIVGRRAFARCIKVGNGPTPCQLLCPDVDWIEVQYMARFRVVLLETVDVVPGSAFGSGIASRFLFGAWFVCPGLVFGITLVRS